MLSKTGEIGKIFGAVATQAGVSVPFIHGVLLAAFTALPLSACSSPSDGGGEGGGASVPSAELCNAQFDAVEKTCPVGADSKDANVETCQEQQRELAGIGCQQPYDTWLSCTTKPGYDCQQDAGCEGPQSDYFTCQSQATQRTGCVRLAPQDAMRCSDAAKPYAFSCLGAAPAQCVQVVTEGAGIWCCPQL